MPGSTRTPISCTARSRMRSIPNGPAVTASCCPTRWRGTGGGTWYVRVDDGDVEVTTDRPNAEPDARISFERGYVARTRAEVSCHPNEAMRSQLVRVEGKMFPVTIFGRWIERSEGRDDPSSSASSASVRYRSSATPGAPGATARYREGRETPPSSARTGPSSAPGPSSFLMRTSMRSGSVRTGRRTRSTSRSTSSTGWRRPAKASWTRCGRCRASTSARSGSPRTWRRS